jgi:protein gp37
MARNSRIEWTDHTFNPWWGCTKKSAACKHCYAEAWSKRVGTKVWGKAAPRRFFGDAHWTGPLAWNKAAEAAGQRHRVFCASMADVFEDRRDLDPWRERLARLISETPSLDWLLLTKRPDDVPDLAPWGTDWPMNVWLGTTIENQREANRRLDGFVDIPARVRFLSCEPLLSGLNLNRWISRIHWVIAGGESGGNARPMDPDWARGLRDQCIAASVPFHFKQWGSWAPADEHTGKARSIGASAVVRVSKKAAGRELDGRHWDGLPAVV